MIVMRRRVPAFTYSTLPTEPTNPTENAGQHLNVRSSDLESLMELQFVCLVESRYVCAPFSRSAPAQLWRPLRSQPHQLKPIQPLPQPQHQRLMCTSAAQWLVAQAKIKSTDMQQRPMDR